MQREHLARQPVCQACGGTEALQVHHIQPFHLSPELEMVPDNLITLCEAPGRGCHFMFGHLYSWKSWNENVVKDAAIWRRKIEGRP